MNEGEKTMGGLMLGADVDPVGLDPGVTRLVAWLRGHGFRTTDSGDGKTKFADGFTEDDGVWPCAHVAIAVQPAALVSEADRLVDLLWDEHGIQVSPTPPEPTNEPELDATYCAASKSAMLILMHVDDNLLVTVGEGGA